MEFSAIAAASDEMAIGASDNFIYIFSIEDPKSQIGTVNCQLLTKFSSHTNSVFSLCYSSDGNELYSGGRDALLHSYDVLNEYYELRKVPAHLYTINDIVLLDTNLFATASRDKNIKIWNQENLELLKVIDLEKFTGHKNSVNKLCWLNKENILVSVSDDRSIIAWKIKV